MLTFEKENAASKARAEFDGGELADQKIQVRPAPPPTPCAAFAMSSLRFMNSLRRPGHEPLRYVMSRYASPLRCVSAAVKISSSKLARAWKHAWRVCQLRLD